MDKKINILFVLHDSNLNSGATRSMIDVIDTLVLKDDIVVTVLLCGQKGTATDYLERKGIKCLQHKYGRWAFHRNASFVNKINTFLKLWVKYLYDLVVLKKYDKLINEENINLIYSNTSVVYIGSLLARRYRIPHIWHIREFCKEDHNLGLCFGENKLVSKINQSNAVIYISNSVKDKYSSRVFIPQYVFYNDISPDFINPKRIDDNVRNELQAVIIGTIQKGKGQLEAIQAVEIIQKKNINIKLHICGAKNGEYYNLLEKYVKEHNLNHFVIFEGFVNDTVEYRKKMDIGIVSSRKEGFGRVTIEGMLSGLIIIGADAAGTGELIADGTNGLLYQMGNAKDLADKLEYVYNNQQKAWQISKEGYRWARDTFTKGECAEKIYSVMKELT